ncbi:MAG TPA: ATPase, T2SS/T4P/T4SS family, partial [Labilithrix sp.]|nr:ATPase, T2SS/T4P/T4SS family [Labilithrix sp.]
MSAQATSVVRLLATVTEDEQVDRRTLEVLGGTLTLGRDARCTLPLTTGFASRQHAVVDVRGSAMNVRDVSMNGTFVGGALVKQSAVSVPFGTPIRIGPYTIVLERADAPRALPAPRLVAPPAATPPTQVFGSAGRDAWAEENVLRTEIHKRLLEHLDLGAVDASRSDDPTLRPKVLAALRAIVQGLGDRVPPGMDRDVLVGSLLDEAIGLGPVERFLSDPTVNEIMVVDPNTIFLEIGGKLVRADARFTNDDRVRATIERIVTPLGRRIDESVPLVDARLADGSRVNAVIRPLALRGAAITIRKFSRKPFTMARLVELGALTGGMG